MGAPIPRMTPVNGPQFGHSLASAARARRVMIGRYTWDGVMLIPPKAAPRITLLDRLRHWLCHRDEFTTFPECELCQNRG